MLRDRRCVRFGRCRCEHDLTSNGTCVPAHIQQSPLVAKLRGVNRTSRCHASLQLSLAKEQPAKELEGGKRILRHQLKRALEKYVRFYQRSIEIQNECD